MTKSKSISPMMRRRSNCQSRWHRRRLLISVFRKMCCASWESNERRESRNGWASSSCVAASLRLAVPQVRHSRMLPAGIQAKLRRTPLKPFDGDNIAAVGDDPRNEDFAGRKLDVFPQAPLVLMTRVRVLKGNCFGVDL